LRFSYLLDLKAQLPLPPLGLRDEKPARSKEFGKAFPSALGHDFRPVTRAGGKPSRSTSVHDPARAAIESERHGDPCL
jgi:hypothetical protein